MDKRVYRAYARKRAKFCYVHDLAEHDFIHLGLVDKHPEFSEIMYCAILRQNPALAYAYNFCYSEKHAYLWVQLALDCFLHAFLHSLAKLKAELARQHAGFVFYCQYLEHV